MTRKDYELLARTLREALPEVSSTPGDVYSNGYWHGQYYAVYLITKTLAQALNQDNPRFNPVRFIAAVTGVG